MSTPALIGALVGLGVIGGGRGGKPSTSPNNGCLVLVLCLWLLLLIVTVVFGVLVYSK